MSRQKKTRKISDLMPTRKQDKKVPTVSKKGKKPTRYELDNKAWEEKRKKKHKGRPSGNRYSPAAEKHQNNQQINQDPRIGSRKKILLIMEEGNRQTVVVVPDETKPTKKIISPEQELFELENNVALNELLDQLDAGVTLSKQDQQFVDECLIRIEELMEILGIEDDEDDQDLYQQFEKIDINQFK
ncbi:aminotransferase [Gallibacterium genomosp. 3]|uniref:Der GTPase-activating protein YihI n=1 Tax=Gallibacterium genomosp. 3 TaxID=505345 RepID=A0A1A7NRV8_9PAST|nr:Der GTPase-activating protein YihI [Gallibacterium genomosp. 3]OBW91739.1 aminotransferase [Gallibacterium genomosp. 3]